MCPQTLNNPTALVDVARMLLTEALKVPHNQQFLLLSDACVPLYPPQARARSSFVASSPASLRQRPQPVAVHVIMAPAVLLRIAVDRSHRSDRCACLVQVVWQQLVSEDKSRINTCRGVRSRLPDFMHMQRRSSCTWTLTGRIMKPCPPPPCVLNVARHLQQLAATPATC